MARFASVRHHGWRTQVAWTNLAWPKTLPLNMGGLENVGPVSFLNDKHSSNLRQLKPLV